MGFSYLFCFGAVLLRIINCPGIQAVKVIGDFPTPTNVTITSHNLNTTVFWDYEVTSATQDFAFEVEFFNSSGSWVSVDECKRTRGLHCNLLYAFRYPLNDKCPTNIIDVQTERIRIRSCWMNEVNSCGAWTESMPPFQDIIEPPEFSILDVFDGQLRILNNPHQVANKSLNCYYGNGLKYFIKYKGMDDKSQPEKEDTANFSETMITLPLWKSPVNTMMCVKMSIQHTVLKIGSKWKDICKIIAYEEGTSNNFIIILVVSLTVSLILLVTAVREIKRFYNSIYHEDAKIPNELANMFKEIETDWSNQENPGSFYNFEFSRSESFEVVDLLNHDDLNLQRGGDGVSLYTTDSVDELERNVEFTSSPTIPQPPDPLMYIRHAGPDDVIVNNNVVYNESATTGLSTSHLAFPSNSSLQYSDFCKIAWNHDQINADQAFKFCDRVSSGLHVKSESNHEGVFSPIPEESSCRSKNSSSGSLNICVKNEMKNLGESFNSRTDTFCQGSSSDHVCVPDTEMLRKSSNQIVNRPLVVKSGKRGMREMANPTYSLNDRKLFYEDECFGDVNELTLTQEELKPADNAAGSKLQFQCVKQRYTERGYKHAKARLSHAARPKNTSVYRKRLLRHRRMHSCACQTFTNRKHNTSRSCRHQTKTQDRCSYYSDSQECKQQHAFVNMHNSCCATNSFTEDSNVVNIRTRSDSCKSADSGFHVDWMSLSPPLSPADYFIPQVRFRPEKIPKYETSESNLTNPILIPNAAVHYESPSGFVEVNELPSCGTKELSVHFTVEKNAGHTSADTRLVHKEDEFNTDNDINSSYLKLSTLNRFLFKLYDSPDIPTAK